MRRVWLAHYPSDSKHSSDMRHFRILAHISSDPQDRDHETELLRTDGMDTSSIVRTFSNFAPYEELDEELKERIHLAKTGDLIGIKGLGDGLSDLLRDAWIHRTPLHKKKFLEQGKQRDSLIWQRIITEDPCLD